MLRSTRAALAMGLGCLGVVGLIGGQSVAQGPADGKVQRVANAGTTANGTAPVAAATAAPVLAVGTIDVEKVFKDFDKVKVLGETLEAEVKARYAELTTLANQGKQVQQEHERATPNGPDAKSLEAKMVQLKAQIEATKQNSEREFSQKETEMMVGIYNDIAAMAQLVAQKRGMTLVVKYNEGKLASSDPQSAMASMSKTIIFADPRYDITNDVTYYLNYNYKLSGAPAPKNPNPAPVGAPATGTRTGTPATRTPSPAPAGQPR